MNTPWGDIQVFEGDHIAEMIAENGGYERGVINAVLSNCERRGVFVDVGACYGTHSLAFGQYFEEGFAFEPNEDVIPLLKENVPDNVTVYQAALGHCHQKVGLKGNSENIGNTSIKMDGEIDMMPLDDVLTEEVDLIKIDVEGLEKAVIYGGRGIIEEHRPVILTEFRNHEKTLKKRGVFSKEIIDFNITEFLILHLNYSKALRVGGGNVLFVP